MSKQWVRATGLITTLIVCLVIWQAWFPGQAFDAAVWQADADAGSGVRQRMADRLLARQTLIGLTRAKVVAMLGEPAPTDYFSDWDLVYRLGDERRFVSIDSEWLVLRLGSDGRVAQASLVTD